MTQLDTLCNYLQQPGSPAPNLATLQSSKLVAWAYTRLPRDHELRAALRPAYLEASARHAIVRRSLLKLAADCQQLGIKLLLFKGFPLAEFVYEHAAERHYGDVDVLVQLKDAAALSRLLEAEGWEVVPVDARQRRYNGHEIMHAFHTTSGVRLDVHEFICHGTNRRVQQRLTRGAWNASTWHTWEDSGVYLLDPADAVLLGLATGNLWEGYFKPQNYLDMVQLSAHYNLSEDAVLRRAAELRLSRTVQLFLARCNPWRGVCRLARPSFLERQHQFFTARTEMGYLGATKTALRVLNLPALLLDVLRFCPTILSVIYTLRSTPQLKTALAQILPDTSMTETAGNDALYLHAKRGANWGTRLLMPRTEGRCLVRSLSAFKVLRSRGLPAVFVSGVRRDGDKLVGHAWVEVFGHPVDGWGDETARQHYSVNLVFPAPETMLDI